MSKKKKSPRRKAKKAAHRRRNPARQLALPGISKTTKKRSTMAKKRKAKRPRAVYKTTKRGGHKRRTARIAGPLFRRSKRGKVRRVRRANPGMPAFLANGLDALGGFALGVAIRVGTHMLAPGNATAAKIAGAAGFLGGLALAGKRPALGIALAVGSADAALQNDAVFKAEMMLAPAAPTTAKGMAAIQFQNMRAMQAARQLPAYGRMNAISFDNMHGIGSIAAMRTSNPFDH